MVDMTRALESETDTPCTPPRVPPKSRRGDGELLYEVSSVVRVREALWLYFSENGKLDDPGETRSWILRSDQDSVTV